MKGERIRRYRDGLRAETLAAWRLRLKGYRIRSQRFKSPVGEIDIVATRGRTVVFVEVKRRASHEEALFSVTPHAQSRISRAAALYMARHPEFGHYDMRFDVISVTPPFRVSHLDNAFRPPA